MSSVPDARQVDFECGFAHIRWPMIEVTYFTTVISSWCHWAEPAWAEVQRRFEGRAKFGWKAALQGPESLPASAAQMEWFYQRSGTITRSPYMLNSGWFEAGTAEYIVPDLLAEAGRDFGAGDDRIRLALADAGLRQGKKINRWEVAAPIAAKAAALKEAALRKKAQSPEVERRVRAATAEFHAMQATQRPTFLLQSGIGDKVMVSGLWTAAPLIAAIEAMLDDAAAYASWAAHVGNAPSQ